MNRWDDEHLESLFQRMREEDLQFRPEFGKMWHDGCHVRSRQRRRTIVASMALIATLAAALILGVLPSPRESGRITDNARLDSIDFEEFSAIVVERFRDSSVVAWRSPTEYLLEPTASQSISLLSWNHEPVTN